jgi:hypothetical protein
MITVAEAFDKFRQRLELSARSAGFARHGEIISRRIRPPCAVSRAPLESRSGWNRAMICANG